MVTTHTFHPVEDVVSGRGRVLQDVATAVATQAEKLAPARRQVLGAAVGPQRRLGRQDIVVVRPLEGLGLGILHVLTLVLPPSPTRPCVAEPRPLPRVRPRPTRRCGRPTETVRRPTRKVDAAFLAPVVPTKRPVSRPRLPPKATGEAATV